MDGYSLYAGYAFEGFGLDPSGQNKTATTPAVPYYSTEREKRRATEGENPTMEDMFRDWKTNMGAETREFGPNSSWTKDVQNYKNTKTNAMVKVHTELLRLKAIYDSICTGEKIEKKFKPRPYGVKFGPTDAITTDKYNKMQFVGSFTMFIESDITIDLAARTIISDDKYRAHNKTGRVSFYLHMSWFVKDRSRADSTTEGNMYQNFNWTGGLRVKLKPCPVKVGGGTCPPEEEEPEEEPKKKLGGYASVVE